MHETFDFQSQNIDVDYVTLNLRNGKNNFTKFAQYFHSNYQFNCDFFYNKTGITKSYLVNPYYQHRMVIVFNIDHTNSSILVIQFSGRNAEHFYCILKTQQFDWNVFNLNDLRLTKLDLCYIRFDRPSGESSLLNFFKRSANKFQTRYPSMVQYWVIKVSFCYKFIINIFISQGVYLYVF